MIHLIHSGFEVLSQIGVIDRIHMYNILYYIMYDNRDEKKVASTQLRKNAI